jgi:DNA-binding NtrC family response regulator
LYYFKSFRKKYNKGSLSNSEKALEYLCHYPWPGNIRELRHSMERAVIMGDGDLLEYEDFNLDRVQMSSNMPVSTGRIDDMEKAAIKKALSKGYKSMDRVASEVGLSRSTLYRKMKKYGISDA